MEAMLAYWGGRRLAINAHADFAVLARLYDSLGKVVPHVELQRVVRPKAIANAVARLKEAPPEVKEAITHIRAAIKKAGCFWKVESVKKKGYRLSSDE